MVMCTAWHGMVSHGFYSNYNAVIFDLPEGRLIVEYTSDSGSIAKPRSEAPFAYFAKEGVGEIEETYVKMNKQIQVPQAFLETALAACAAQRKLSEFDSFFRQKPEPL
jgi:hypothetical protein